MIDIQLSHNIPIWKRHISKWKVSKIKIFIFRGAFAMLFNIKFNPYIGPEMGYSNVQSRPGQNTMSLQRHNVK